MFSEGDDSEAPSSRSTRVTVPVYVIPEAETQFFDESDDCDATEVLSDNTCHDVLSHPVDDPEMQKDLSLLSQVNNAKLRHCQAKLPTWVESFLCCP